MSTPDTLATKSAAIPAPLLWALVASAAVHSALVIVPRAYPSQGSSSIADYGRPLQASLVASPEQKGEPVPQQLAELVALASPSTAGLAPQEPATTQLAHALAAPSSAIKNQMPPSVAIGVGAAGEVQVEGMPLQDNNRLGDVLTRQRAEFPTEIDSPVRIKEPIRVRYPAAAMAAGRGDSVAVWAIIDPRGDPDEVVVLDGTPEFAEAVVAAVKETKFVPAQNDLLPRRYPIALEFRFVLGAGAETDSATVAHQP